MTNPTEAVATALHESMVQQDVNGYLDAKIDAGLLATAAIAAYQQAVASESAPAPQPPETLQERVHPWLMECFGPEISADKLERADRFIEEALELLQSGDYPKERVYALVEYVYGREKGDTAQEVGGTMLTLAAYCLSHGLDMHEAGETELARVWTKVDKIRAKQAAKPHGSALPIALESAPSAIPAGWKLVPQDLDKAMIAAALKVDLSNENEESCLHELWHTLYAAAPTPGAENELG